MKFEMSKWNIFIKIAAIVALVASLLGSFTDIIIPGLAPIAFGLTFFGSGLRELNTFKENKEKVTLIMGILLLATGVLSLYVGIKQIYPYFYLN